MADARNYLGELALGQPEISERLMRALELKGDLPRLLRARFDVSVQADDLTAPEFWYLRRGQLFDSTGSQVAVAGQISSANFGASAEVPVIAVVEQVTIVNANAGILAVNIGLVSGPTVANNNQKPRDSRHFSARSAFAVDISAYLPAFRALTLAGSRYYHIPAGTTAVIQGPWVVHGLTPAGASGPAILKVETEALNTAVTASFTWRERALLDTER